jgi:acetyltransferase-like isoleucine patch superfamily enzyme
MNPVKHRTRIEDPLELFPRGLTKLVSLWRSRFYPFASIGTDVSFHFTSRVCRPRAVRISLGNSIILKEYAWLSVATEDPEGEPTIVLEDNCSVGFGTIISAANRIHLEQGVLIGQVVIIQDHNHAYEDVGVPIADQGIAGEGSIRIGQGTWIGHGASIICPRGELKIGRNCVVAANSVVTRSVPDFSVVAGFPARVIRQYDPERRVWHIGRGDDKSSKIADVTPQFISVSQGDT